ncbi:hypothetical protein PHYC_00289 [Phycisphaerales bacterium]|nr:hypothetical protein PHYC_00289 [Phycisphaerales bacterium]
MAETRETNPTTASQEDLSAQIDALLGEIGSASAAPPASTPSAPQPSEADSADLARQMEDILSTPAKSAAAAPDPETQKATDELARQIETLLTPEQKEPSPPVVPLELPESALTPDHAPSAPAPPVAPLPDFPIAAAPAPRPAAAAPPVAATRTPPAPAPAPGTPPQAVEPEVPPRPRGEALLAALAVASKPLADKPKVIRDSLGWIALNSLFLGACLWAYVLFFRHPPHAAEAWEFDFSQGALPTPPSHDEEPPAADGHAKAAEPKKAAKSDAKKKEPAKSDSHGSEKRGGGGH